METTVHFPEVIAVGWTFDQFSTAIICFANKLFWFSLGICNLQNSFQVEVTVVIESRVVDHTTGKTLDNE